jgi:hypothetical protein
MRIRNISLFLTTLALSALILAAGAYVVIASPGVRAPATLGPSAVSSSETEYSSGWVNIAQGELRTFTHTLGALGLPPERYAVELWFQDTDGGRGINRRYYGGVEINGDPNPARGAHWQNLTTDTIQVFRAPNDDVADMVNVRVWVVPKPDFQSQWVNIGPDTTRTFSHGLGTMYGITEADLTVGLWFSNPVRGIHQFAYGGLTVDPTTGTLGAFWHNLTSDTVQVTRYPSDTAVPQVRVTVVRAEPTSYDSGWLTIAQDEQRLITHDLNWNTDMLLVRGECQTTTLGIHQKFAGGDHAGTAPGGAMRGANLENLTITSVVAYRRGEDGVCGEFRVRIWKRSANVYLPTVFKDYQ